MKLNTKNILSYYFILGMIIGLVACSKMDGTYHQFIKNGPVVYTGKADSVLALSGRNRVKLVWQVSDPAITTCKIFWLTNGIPDSTEINTGQISGLMSLNYVIENLPENSYNFTIYSYDKFGNASVPTEKMGIAYGDTYVASLNNRQIKSIILSGDGLSAQINWYNSGINEIGTELKYFDPSGAEHHVVVPTDESVWNLTDFEYASDMEFRSLYLPDSAAIDTFHTEYAKVKLPKYIIKIDKSLFEQYYLPGDVNENIYGTYSMPRLWDDNITGSSWYCSATTGVPNRTFAFDMGNSVSLSSFRIWQRFKDGIANAYNSANPRIFEVWGTNSMPDADGSWENWTKLADCEIVKPSGLPGNNLNDADKEALENGHEFNFADDSPQVRYIRFRIKETFDPKRIYVFFSELSFYGTP